MLVTLDRIEKDIEKILRKMEPSVSKEHLERRLACLLPSTTARQVLEALIERCE